MTDMTQDTHAPRNPSIARDLFLLLTKENGYTGGSRPSAVTAGALTDLVLAGRIALSDDKDPRVTILDGSPTGDPVLDHVLSGVAERSERKEPTLSGLIKHRSLDPSEAIGDDLVAAGVLERKNGLLGTSWPTVDGRAEQSLRAHLAAVLEGREQPIPQDAAILGILRSVDAVRPTLKDDVPDMSKKDLNRRIEEIAQATPISDALKKSFDTMQSAIMMGWIVPVIIAT